MASGEPQRIVALASGEAIGRQTDSGIGRTGRGELQPLPNKEREKFMNRFTQRVVHALIASLVFAVLAAAPVFGQIDKTPGGELPPLPTPTPVRGEPQPPGKIDPRVICEIRRAPIPFKPFAMLDPETGAPVTPLTRIRVLRGTKWEKIILAGLYYEYINSYERYLNERGYTLRNGKDDPDEILFQRTCINEGLMQHQEYDIKSKHLQLPPGSQPLYTELTPETVARLSAEHQRQTALDPARLKRVEAGKRCDLDAGFEEEKEKSFGFELGEKDKFWVGVSGGYLLAPKREPLEVTVEGEAKAQAALFSFETDLLRATAKAHAVEQGELTAEIKLSVIGIDVWNPSLPPGTASWSKTDTFTRPFDYSKDFHFTIGPVPMVARVGARGDISLKYFVGLRPFNAQADINPSVFSEAYVEAGVDLFLAEAGAGSALTLLNDKLNIYAEIGIDGDEKGIFYYKHFSGTNEFSALDGRLYLYAKIDAPWPFDDKKWTYDLWNWKGFSAKGTLFNLTPSETKKYLFFCPPNDAKFIAQSVPSLMTAGQRYLVSITMRNTGQNAWTAGQGYRLGSWNPENNTTWGFSRVELPMNQNRTGRITVQPGEQVTFQFNVTAPSVASLYRFQWRMVREGVVGYFGEPTRRMLVGTVTGTIAAAPNPIRVCDGSGKGEATLSWFSDSPALEVHIGAPNGPLLARSGQSGSVATGKTVTDGTVFYLQNVANGLPLTAINTLATVKVNLTTSGCPPNDAVFVSQSVPATMKSGQSYLVSVTMKNVGANTWTAGKGYRLGSQSPQDNLLWGLHRVELPINVNDPARSRVSVPPGGQVTFSFTVKAPAVPATTVPVPRYFQWRMVQELVEWFGEPTPRVPITVTP